MEDVLRWGWMARPPARSCGTTRACSRSPRDRSRLVRDAGALAPLPINLTYLGLAIAWMGDFAGAAVARSRRPRAWRRRPEPLSRPTPCCGSGHCKAGKPRPRADRERDRACSSRRARDRRRPGRTGRPRSCTTASPATRRRRRAARQATSDALEPWSPCGRCPSWSRRPRAAGDAELARDALERLAETTQPCGTDFGLGIEARCRALLSEGDGRRAPVSRGDRAAGRTRLRPELARAHLLYGEWLRRENRRVDAREQLRAAHDMFAAIGMEAFAERARRSCRRRARRCASARSRRATI